MTALLSLAECVMVLLLVLTLVNLWPLCDNTLLALVCFQPRSTSKALKEVDLLMFMNRLMVEVPFLKAVMERNVKSCLIGLSTSVFDILLFWGGLCCLLLSLVQALGMRAF